MRNCIVVLGEGYSVVFEGRGRGYNAEGLGGEVFEGVY